jgi:hypothetical protein
MTTTLTEVLWALAKEARTLEQLPVTDDALVDTVGTIRAIETRLAAVRKSLTAEITGPQDGSDYRAVTNRKAVRSYNTNGILIAFSDARTDDPLRLLMEADAVRLQWRWTQLKNACHRYDVPLDIAFHEIEDGDPDAMVGEIWTDDLRVEAIPADEQSEVGF